MTYNGFDKHLMILKHATHASNVSLYISLKCKIGEVSLWYKLRWRLHLFMSSWATRWTCKYKQTSGNWSLTLNFFLNKQEYSPRIPVIYPWWDISWRWLQRQDQESHSCWEFLPSSIRCWNVAYILKRWNVSRQVKSRQYLSLLTLESRTWQNVRS